MQTLQLKTLRKRAGFNTQADLARTLGMNPRTYASWEREEVKLTFGDAQRIADVLGCSLDELAGRAQPIDDRPLKRGADADKGQTEIVRLFNQLDDPRKKFLLEAARGLAASAKSEAAMAVTTF